MGAVKVQLTEQQIQKYSGDKRRAELTLAEVNQVPEDTRLFRAVGKCFVLETRSTVVSGLDNKVAECEKEVASLKNKRKWMEESLAQSKANVEELLRQRQEMASS